MTVAELRTLLDRLPDDAYVYTRHDDDLIPVFFDADVEIRPVSRTRLFGTFYAEPDADGPLALIIE